MSNFKKGFLIFLVGVLLVTLLDSLGAIASRNLDFKYSNLAAVSTLLYLIIAFLITKNTDKKTGVFFAGLLGLFDATIGWKISMLLKANVGNSKTEISSVVWIIMAIFMTIFASIIGLIGAWAATLIYKVKHKPLISIK